MKMLDSIQPASEPAAVSVIRARTGWQMIDCAELYRNRDLFRFLVWREVKVRYAQSAIGIGWAVIPPFFTMLVFTVVFGRLADVPSDGVPYAVFSFAALAPWMYFSNALTDGVQSLIANANMLRKTYFPRMLMPLAAVLARLVDLSIAMLMLLAIMAWYRIVPTIAVLAVPWLLLILITAAGGIALWLTALAVQYRDVKHAMPFVVQILMYAAPVVYPTSLVPPQYQLLYAVNPMVGVIEGFRAALLGNQPMPWRFLAVGTCSALLIALGGAVYFRHKERLFADVA